MINFNFTSEERRGIMSNLYAKLDAYYEHPNDTPLSLDLDNKAIDDLIKSFDLDQPINAEESINKIVDGFKKYDLHTNNPKYFGLFNPRVNFGSIVSDFISSYFNPQLAAWSHAPFAVQIENYLIEKFGEKFGYVTNEIDGTFANGGAEANLTALLSALNHKYSNLIEEGILGLKERPIIYCSDQSHHSILKAAKVVGLGINAVKAIESTQQLKLDPDKLIQRIKDDISNGYAPLMVIGTAGTTGSGAIDDLIKLSNICTDFNLWFHVDAAFGGGAILNEDCKLWLKGIERSNSITFDIHKWLSVSNGTSMFITRNKGILQKTFNVSTDYMPDDQSTESIIDPYVNSIQWSRRSNGLKLFISLSIFGWKGYSEVIKHHSEMGDFLKYLLIQKGWKIYNDSKLPIICFSDPDYEDDPEFAESIKNKVVESGEAWISSYPIKGINTLRACITNFSSNENDIVELVDLLDQKRNEFKGLTAKNFPLINSY